MHFVCFVHAQVFLQATVRWALGLAGKTPYTIHRITFHISQPQHHSSRAITLIGKMHVQQIFKHAANSLSVYTTNQLQIGITLMAKLSKQAWWSH